MALLSIVPVRELYDGVDWPVVVLLGALIPLGTALETTGATQVLVGGILGVEGGVFADHTADAHTRCHNDGVRCP